MAATVLINDIVDALEMQFDEYSNYLNLDTGQVESVSRRLLNMAEEDSDSDADERGILGWEKNEWEVAKQVVATDRFLRLPTKYDVDDWAIMQEFVDSLKPGKIRQELLNAIHGSGAFRHFKDTLRRHRIEEDWYQFRTEALRQIAIDWCEEFEITWK